MKSKIYLFWMALMLSACAVSVRDKETPVQESELPTMNEAKLNEAFQEGKIDSSSLSSFNRIAEEKLTEFFELTDVIANSEIDEELRKNAFQQAVSLFDEERNPIIQYNNEQYALDEFLQHIHDAEIQLNKVSEVQMIEKFSISDEGQYKSKLAIHYLPQLTPDNAEVILRQTTKQFGEKEKQVWEVYLLRLDLR